MTDYIKVNPGDEVYLVTGSGPYNRKAEISRAEKKTVHKQHKNGNFVLESGREAKKYNFKSSTWNKWAPWEASSRSRSDGYLSRRSYVVPVTPETTEYINAQLQIVENERRAFRASDLIEQFCIKHRRDGDKADLFEQALAVLKGGDE